MWNVPPRFILWKSGPPSYGGTITRSLDHESPDLINGLIHPWVHSWTNGQLGGRASLEDVGLWKCALGGIPCSRHLLWLSLCFPNTMRWAVFFYHNVSALSWLTVMEPTDHWLTLLRQSTPPIVFLRYFVTVTQTGRTSPERRLLGHTKAKTAAGNLTCGCKFQRLLLLGAPKPDGLKVFKVYLGTPREPQGSFQRVDKVKAFPLGYQDGCYRLTSSPTT